MAQNVSGNLTTPPMPNEALLVPKSLKRSYSCTQEVLGKGCFGSVVKGVDLLTKSPVAIKTQPSSLIAKAEAQMASIIQAPHAVPCRAAFENSPQKIPDHPKKSYLVMDLIAENTIVSSFLLPGKPRLKFDEIITILRQSLEFLDALSNKGIAVFDFKPQNMIFRRSCRSVTFIDFGGAREIVNMNEIPMVVSYNFCAPEYFLKGELTTAFDLWSLGLTMYTLLTERIFFSYDTKLPKEKRIDQILQLIAGQIGKPTVEYLSRCQDPQLYFTAAGDFKEPIPLTSTKHWKDVVYQAGKKNSWPLAYINQFIEILSQLIRYEGRTSPKELLKSPLFHREIAAHLEYDKRQKCKIYFNRSFGVSPAVQLTPIDLGTADLTIDLNQSVEPCLHIPRDPDGNYILILEKNGVLINHRVALQDGGILNIKPYQDHLDKLTNKARCDLSQLFSSIKENLDLEESSDL